MSGAIFLGRVAKAHLLWDQSGLASAGITHKTDPNQLLLHVTPWVASAEGVLGHPAMVCSWFHLECFALV